MHTNLIGVIYDLKALVDNGPEPLLSLGVDSVQLNCGGDRCADYLTPENAAKARMLLDGKIQITSFWAGWSGPAVWDSIDGPHTLGLVPPAYRAMRMKELMLGADFASALGVSSIATHVGFIPEQPSYPEYRGVIQAVKHVALYCKKKGLGFNFETGQETPVTLMRAIKDIGLDNVGINLDPANLILYGRGNPVDAISVFKGYIKGVHVKDGDYSTDFTNLGQERVVGEGSVNFPVFLPKLLNEGYTGDLYIEREISGEKQREDILKTVEYLKGFLGKKVN
ncbi:MAG: sugar phosphate isomerase/epimerase [Clostridiales bacterium]|jgi:sugar phosphate isomerase/epimerase|nr:sugar phosphate isomerase/epimerase [Clostridiales bacterium]MDR2751045.1 sugar phosphate isomerase/epimerase [Clostridiales bacterium]